MAGEAGQQMPADNPARAGAHQLRSRREILFPQGEQLGPHGTGQAGPVQQAEDQGNAEIDPQGRPGDRQRGGQRHPQRQHREGPQHFDDSLYDRIDPTAVISGQPADADAEEKADRDADKADGQRYPRTDRQAGEHVASHPVRSEQEQGAAPCGAEQADIHLDQAPEPVGLAAAQEADPVNF